MSDLEDDMKFDEFIRDRYENYSMPVNDEFWEGINAKLNQERLVQNQRKIRTLQVISISTVALMIGMFYFFNSKISYLEEALLYSQHPTNSQNSNPDISASASKEYLETVTKNIQKLNSPVIKDASELYIDKLELLQEAPKSEHNNSLDNFKSNHNNEIDNSLQENSTELKQKTNESSSENEFTEYKESNSYLADDNEINTTEINSILPAGIQEDEIIDYAKGLSNLETIIKTDDSYIENQSQFSVIENTVDSMEQVDYEVEVIQNEVDQDDAKVQESTDNQQQTNSTEQLEVSSFLQNSKSKPIILEAFYAPGISGRLLRGNLQEGTSGLNKNYFNNVESGAFFNSFGAGVSMQVSNKIRMKTGISYSKYNIDIQPSDTLMLMKQNDQYFAQTSLGVVPIRVDITSTEYYTTDTIEVIDEIENPDDTNEDNDDDGDDDDSEDGKNNNDEKETETKIVVTKKTITKANIQKARVEFTYISIPLEFQFSITERLYFNLGVIADFEIKNNTVNYRESMYETVSTSNDQKSKFSLSASLGIGYEHPINNTFSVFINPTFSTFLTPISKDYPIKSYLYSFKAVTGIRIKL